MMQQQYCRSLILLAAAALLLKAAASSPQRRLQDNAAAAVDYSYFEYDLSDFSVRFEKCQFVKMYDDERAEDRDADSVLATRQFVLFKLCPSDTCDESCSGTHGEYILDIYDYLDATVQYQQQQFEYMCQNCNQGADGTGDGDEASGCGQLCYEYDNLEANGFIDAAQFLECQKVDMQNEQDEQEGEEQEGGEQEQEGDQENEFQLYIGPKCSRDTSRIVIGLFTDEDCGEPYTEQSVQDVLGYKLSYHILQQTYSSGDGTVCLSCEEQQDAENNNANDNADADDVNEMCEDLYHASAKCESPYGIQAGFIQTKREDGEYENQVENEFMACTFVDNIKYNSYTQTGEIDISSEQDEVIRYLTPLQLASMSVLILVSIGMGAYGYWLDKTINRLNDSPRVDLASQSDYQLT